MVSPRFGIGSYIEDKYSKQSCFINHWIAIDQQAVELII